MCSQHHAWMMFQQSSQFYSTQNPEQWLDWIGLSNKTVDTTVMSYSEKLTDLQGLVSGDAKSLIRGYGCYGSKNNLPLKHLSKKQLWKINEDTNFLFLTTGQHQ